MTDVRATLRALEGLAEELAFSKSSQVILMCGVHWNFCSEMPTSRSLVVFVRRSWVLLQSRINPSVLVAYHNKGLFVPSHCLSIKGQQETPLHTGSESQRLCYCVMAFS